MCYNLHERSGIDWIERKILFQIFLFSSYGHFLVILWRHHPIFDEVFTITRKIKIWEFLYYIFHSFQPTLNHPLKPDQNWGGGSLHILSWEKPGYFNAQLVQRSLESNELSFFRVYIKECVYCKTICMCIG